MVVWGLYALLKKVMQSTWNAEILRILMFSLKYLECKVKFQCTINPPYSSMCVIRICQNLGKLQK